MTLDTYTIVAPANAEDWASDDALSGEVSYGLLTYAVLQAELSENGDGSRNDRYILKEWLAFTDLDPSSRIGDELDKQFTPTLNRFADTLLVTRSVKTVQNISSRMRSIQRVFQRLKQSEGLPPELDAAIRARLLRLGKSINWLGSYSENLNVIGWAKGISSPRRTAANEAALFALEETLELQKGTLVKRAWPVQNQQVAELSDDVPYRRYLEVTVNHKYALALADMPEGLRNSVQRLIEHKRKAEHWLPDLGLVHMELTHIWSSDETVKMRTHALQRFFGYLLLPKMTGTRQFEDWAEAIKYGPGLAIDKLRLTMLVDPFVLNEYMKYCSLRTFDREHFLHYEATAAARNQGMAPPPPIQFRKSLPASFEGFLALCSSLVNKPTSFLRMHPEFGQELTPQVSAEQWEEWCVARHEAIRTLIEAAQKKVEHAKRSNKAVLGEVLRQEDPRLPFLKMIDAMKRDMPPNTQPVLQALHWRDVTIISLLSFECLRAKNICGLDLGRHFVERNGRYTIFVPKHEMKNYIWGHAEDIVRELPDDLADVFKLWLKVYRPMFKGHDKTNALFLNYITNPVKNPGVDPLRMTTLSLGRIIANKTKKYLGVAVRTHAFRNINSTSVVRMGGSIAQVKAALNDSAKTASEVYLDVKNADEYKGLTALYLKSKAKAAEE